MHGLREETSVQMSFFATSMISSFTYAVVTGYDVKCVVLIPMRLSHVYLTLLDAAVDLVYGGRLVGAALGGALVHLLLHLPQELDVNVVDEVLDGVLNFALRLLGHLESSVTLKNQVKY